MQNRDVALAVGGVAAGYGDESPLVVLQDSRKSSSLRIPVGPAEASAIILALEGVQPYRPLTHDILASFFRDHGFRLECAEIYDCLPDEDVGERFLARIRYRKAFRRWSREVRPSDAIALALRLKAPIRAPRELMERKESGRLSGVAASRLPLYLKVPSHT
jgi:bifunctional DNase/RNase